MKTVLSACVALWLVAMATAEDIPKCYGVTDDQITKIKSMVVKEDVHSLLARNLSQVYGPKEILEVDHSSCIEFVNQKTDDDSIAYAMVTGGTWFMEKKREGTLHKAANGIYLMKRANGETKAVEYIFYAKGNVLGHFICWTTAPPTDSPKKMLPFITGILTAERPMKEGTITDVEEVKAKIIAQPEVFGTIDYYSVLC